MAAIAGLLGGSEHAAPEEVYPDQAGIARPQWR
jgi:hypothetical protein